jgi:hypothetical protein
MLVPAVHRKQGENEVNDYVFIVLACSADFKEQVPTAYRFL